MASAQADPPAEHADVVVVGSGFGGSVSAFRLAQAGLSVVLLERGRSYPPDSFPRTPAEMGRAFWNPGAGLYGMFDVWRFSGCDSVVSSGLGGGSLIYANVMLRKDEHWFVRDEPLPRGGYESWPVTRADLDPHYDEVERMLGATPYPLEAPGYAGTPKTHAMRDAAAELGLNWQLPPLAVSFAPAPGAEPGRGLPIADPAYGNLHGRRAARAGCAVSVTSAATSAPRTPWITTISPPRSTMAPTCGPVTRSGPSGPGLAADTRWTTSSTTCETRTSRLTRRRSDCGPSDATGSSWPPAPTAPHTCSCAAARASAASARPSAAASAATATS